MTSLPIHLPFGFVPSVSEKASVTVGQVLAKKSTHPDITLHIAQALGVSVKDVAKFIKKNPGDKVMPGDVLAKKGGVFGSNQVASKVEGTVLKLDREQGALVIRLQGSEVPDENAPDTILAPLDGIVSMCNNEQIVIDTDKDVIIGSNGYGGSETAEAFVILDDGQEVQLHHLTPDCIGKIVVGNTFVRDVLVKAIGIGAAGVVGQEIAEGDLEYIQSKRLDTPVVVIGADDMQKVRKAKFTKLFINGEAKTLLLLKA